jgi:membrane protein insertase Oxa1/YidC/SpoIIIJ
MLFLPAGLGVYMFTNSLLGIVQQRVIEGHAKKALADKRPAVVDTVGVDSSDANRKAKRSS